MPLKLLGIIKLLEATLFLTSNLYRTVYGLLALDIAQTGLSTRFSWVYLVEDWGNYGVFIDAKPTWTGPTMPVMAGLGM